MTVVVGVGHDESALDAVVLGALMSTFLGQNISLAHVHPPTIDYPSIGHVDAEWGAFLAEQGNDVLDRAAEHLARVTGSAQCDRHLVAARSVGRGLRDLAEREDASAIVIGAGSRHHDGHVVFGSVAHSLLHSASHSIALAPDGYRTSPPSALERLVVGFSGATESTQTLDLAVELASRAAIPVELLTVVVRATHIANARLGRDPEREILDALVEQRSAEQAAIVMDRGITGRVVQGGTPDEAMREFDWRAGDAFVLGSSARSLLNRVFLGETSHKLMRVSTVPVVILPRLEEPL